MKLWMREGQINITESTFHLAAQGPGCFQKHFSNSWSKILIHKYVLTSLVLVEVLFRTSINYHIKSDVKSISNKMYPMRWEEQSIYLKIDLACESLVLIDVSMGKRG